MAQNRKPCGAKPQALWRSIYRDSLFPRTEYAEAWKVLQRDLPRRDACRWMVDLLFIAAKSLVNRPAKRSWHICCRQTSTQAGAKSLDAGRSPEPKAKSPEPKARSTGVTAGTKGHGTADGCRGHPTPPWPASMRCWGHAHDRPRDLHPHAAQHADCAAAAQLPQALGRDRRLIFREGGADTEGRPAARFLAVLAEYELAERDMRRIRRHPNKAQLPVGKTLATFDFKALPTLPRARVEALAAGDWLDGGGNLIAIRCPAGDCMQSPRGGNRREGAIPAPARRTFCALSAMP